MFEHETYLTPFEVALILRVSPLTLKRWRYKHIGPKWIVQSDGGRKIRYRKSDIEEFFARRTVRTKDSDK